MLTETITLDSSGTILLPLPMRQALGISIGSELIIGLTDQGLVRPGAGHQTQIEPT